MYLLVQYEIKNELGAKSFNLEARLGQVDSLNAKRGGNLKDVYRTSIFYVDNFNASLCIMNFFKGLGAPS